jgi:hypothetical protein
MKSIASIELPTWMVKWMTDFLSLTTRPRKSPGNTPSQPQSIFLSLLLKPWFVQSNHVSYPCLDQSNNCTYFWLILTFTVCLAARNGPMLCWWDTSENQLWVPGKAFICLIRGKVVLPLPFLPWTQSWCFWLQQLFCDYEATHWRAYMTASWGCWGRKKAWTLAPLLNPYPPPDFVG